MDGATGEITITDVVYVEERTDILFMWPIVDDKL